ncbi:MAG: Na+/H+ antiporter NhaA [Rhodospirillaceae bacterium]|nr:Na+/H+ antiporter NhaA [Rhodospirillaceae bacterium]
MPLTAPMSAIDDFLKRESGAGTLLVAAAALALAVANSPLGAFYAGLLATPITVAVGDFAIAKPLNLWINDGLMAWFFFLVGLEIKREVLEGELSTPAKAVLPAVAAIGGIAGPAAVYAAFNWGESPAMNGWAIPAATDIAFALGILALLGSRVPVSLKIFLTALAIIDDLGAIVIIALFYTADLSATALTVAAACIVVLVALNLAGVRRVDVFIGVGIILWVAVLKSGVHATLAGVVTALAVPLKPDAAGFSPLTHLEEALHGWVQYFILPVFAFANAGLDFAALTVRDVFSPIALGIALGLLVGKQAGVMLMAGLCFACGVPRPDGASLAQFYGVAVLTGVGFTMSLFIGDLAFADPALAGQVKAGVLAGSLASAVLGYAILRLSLPANLDSQTARA